MKILFLNFTHQNSFRDFYKKLLTNSSSKSVRNSSRGSRNNSSNDSLRQICNYTFRNNFRKLSKQTISGYFKYTSMDHLKVFKQFFFPTSSFTNFCKKPYRNSSKGSLRFFSRICVDSLEFFLRISSEKVHNFFQELLQRLLIIPPLIDLAIF